ncbi:MAG: type II toxin-antitoxin system YafQ family toxin [Candidatus Gastranaerophilales bacterium]
MYKIIYSTQMKRSLKLIKKRGKNLSKLNTVLNILASGEQLPEKFKDHNLVGNYNKYRECHIEPDWLLIYTIEEDVLILTLVQTGTHSDLF